MVRFLVVWCVFSTKTLLACPARGYKQLANSAHQFLCLLLRYGPMPLLLGVARGLCSLRLLGMRYRNRGAVATQNYRCLTGEDGDINTAWVAIRRQMLELGATWAQNPATLRQMQDCTRQLDKVVAPLVQQNVPVVLAPLHSVSDILAAMVGAGVTPGKASVVVSSSAERYTSEIRKTGDVALSYCSIHQDNTQLAGELMSLIADMIAGQRNMIIFPDITPDYTVQTHEAQSSKIACRLFGRPAKLHSGVVRLSRVMSAQVIFYHLYYQQGIKIKIHSPLPAKNVAVNMPTIIENTMRDYPNDWLLWHSHSLYFINH